MKNPYADQHDDLDLQIGRRAAYWVIYVFLLLITLPPLYRNLSDGFTPVRALFTPQTEGGIVAHLKAVEEIIEDAPFTEAPRYLVQTALTRGPLQEGNRKTHIGRDGWLYFKTALSALGGYGPVRPEPDSVAKDPNRPPWRSPLGAITTFAGQLAETDTKLLLVPIPVKPMIYPEYLGIDADNPIAHPDAELFYSQIASLPNVDVLDLSRAFWEAKTNFQVFLKQDTHWTPEGMELAAEQIRLWLDENPWSDPAHGLQAGDRERRSSRGDLVEKLGIGDGGFAPELADAAPVRGEARDESSPVVLLGDSFTNIYSDEIGLRWGGGAGFAEQLALRLGMPLDVIAINGGAATEVREQLAKRKGAATLMRDKKLVIWAIAARDLFLSETAARDGRIEWDDVAFDTREPDPPAPDGDAAPEGVEPIGVKAKLVAKSHIDDPKTTDYRELLYAAEYELIDALQGEAPETEDGRFLVLHWAFRERQMLPSAAYEIGAVREMQLVPFEEMRKLKTLEQSNDSELFVDLLWELPSGEAGEDTTGTVESATSPLLPTLGCALFAAALGFGLWRAERRK